MSRPHILIARAIAPQVVDFLRQSCEVQDNQADIHWSQEALIAQLQGKDGFLATGILQWMLLCWRPAPSSRRWPI